MNNNSDLLVVRLDQPGVDLALRPRLVLLVVLAAGHSSNWGCPLLCPERLPVRSEEWLLKDHSWLPLSTLLASRSRRTRARAGADGGWHAKSESRGGARRPARARDAPGAVVECTERCLGLRNPHGTPHAMQAHRNFAGIFAGLHYWQSWPWACIRRRRRRVDVT